MACQVDSDRLTYFKEQSRKVLQETLKYRRIIRDAHVELRGIPVRIWRASSRSCARDEYGQIKSNLEVSGPEIAYIVFNVTEFLKQIDNFPWTVTDDQDLLPLEGKVKLTEDIRPGDRVEIDFSYLTGDQEKKVFEVTAIKLQNHIEQLSKVISLRIYTGAMTGEGPPPPDEDGLPVNQCLLPATSTFIENPCNNYDDFTACEVPLMTPRVIIPDE